MAIKIIKNSTNFFTMECENCECVFTYQRVDLMKSTTCSYVRCPCCKEEILHDKRNKHTEDEWYGK